MTKISEYLSNLNFYIKYKLGVKIISKSVKPIKLNTPPPIDMHLDLVEFDEVYSTVANTEFKIIDSVPDDEKFLSKILFVKIFSFISYVTKKLYNNKYRLSSDAECFELYKKLYRPYFNYDIVTDNRILDYSDCIQSGPFTEHLINGDDFYIIDSLYISKYEFKSNYHIPAVKAFFKLINNKIELDHIYFENKYYDANNSEMFSLGKRLLFNYLLIDTVINKHLILTHLKVAQTFSFGIRKYLDSDNPLKHFLWNFCVGVHSTNNNLIPFLIAKDIGTVHKFFKKKKKGVLNYINDLGIHDHTKHMFPLDDDIPSDLKDDSKKIFTIYKYFIHIILLELNNKNYDELKNLINFITEQIPEYVNFTLHDILASFMYVSSVQHYINNNMLLNYVLKGYSCPVGITKDDEKISKYDYLYALNTLVDAMCPMRKVICELDESFNYIAREVYKNMVYELLDTEYKVINIRELESAVQI